MSTNSVGRAYILGKVLTKHHDIEIIGPMFATNVWPPIDQTELNYRAIPAKSLPHFLKSAALVIKNIKGDVIYALKPLSSSFGLSLISKSFHQRPIVLDIDDWEIGFVKWNMAHTPIKTLASIHNPNWLGWTILLDKLIQLADRITTSGEFLTKKYGGYFVPHGRDVNFLDPSRFDSVALRKELGFGNEKIILFLGTPKPHKGIKELVEAVNLVPDKGLKILLVGAEMNDPFVRSLVERNQDIFEVVGMRPLSERPRWLAIADVVVLPQQASTATIGQVPAKLFDAMAMAKPIVATAVSDIPSILDRCGLVVPAGDVEALASKISYIINQPQEALLLGTFARDKCIREYSTEVMERVLLEVFSGL